MHEVAIWLAASSSPLGGSAPSIAIPGTNVLRGLLEGLSTVVLVIAGIGLLVSAGMMAIGSHSSNGRLADRGRSGVLASIIGAVIAGAALALVNFAWTLRGKIHP